MTTFTISASNGRSYTVSAKRLIVAEAVVTAFALVGFAFTLVKVVGLFR